MAIPVAQSLSLNIYSGRAEKVRAREKDMDKPTENELQLVRNTIELVAPGSTYVGKHCRPFGTTEGRSISFGTGGRPRLCLPPTVSYASANS